MFLKAFLCLGSWRRGPEHQLARALFGQSVILLHEVGQWVVYEPTFVLKARGRVYRLVSPSAFAMAKVRLLSVQSEWHAAPGARERPIHTVVVPYRRTVAQTVSAKSARFEQNRFSFGHSTAL